MAIKDQYGMSKHSDGILGLSAAKHDVPSLVTRLYEQGVIDYPIVSMSLNHFSDTDLDSEIILGGINDTHYKEHFHQFETTSPFFW